MNLRTATMVLVTLATLQLQAQQPEAIPAPPANAVSDDGSAREGLANDGSANGESANGDGLFVSPVSETKPVVDTKAQGESTRFGSILVEATPTDQHEHDSPSEATADQNGSLVLDRVPAIDGATLSSTIGGIEAPLNSDATIVTEPIYSPPIYSPPIIQETVVSEAPFNQPQVVQTPEFQTSPPIVQPTYTTAPQQPVFRQPVYQQPVHRQSVHRQPVYQQTVSRQVPQQPRRMTMTVTEATAYRSAQPQAVRRASYYQRVPGASAYPQVVVVSPGGQVVGVQALVATPAPRPLLYSGPVSVVPAPLVGGAVVGPAGQVPMPRAFVPGQPIRNFVRGIGPY